MRTSKSPGSSGKLWKIAAPGSTKGSPPFPCLSAGLFTIPYSYPLLESVWCSHCLGAYGIGGRCPNNGEQRGILDAAYAFGRLGLRKCNSADYHGKRSSLHGLILKMSFLVVSAGASWSDSRSEHVAHTCTKTRRRN